MIFTLAPIIIVKMTYLRQFCFHNSHTCANYDFTIVVLAPIMILQSSQLRQL